MMAKKQKKSVQDAAQAAVQADAVADQLEADAYAARQLADKAERKARKEAKEADLDDENNIIVRDKSGKALATVAPIPQILPMKVQPTEEALLKRTAELAAIRAARNPVDDFDAALFARLANS